MIQQALQALTNELNAYLKHVFNLTDSQAKVTLTAFTGPEGSAPPDTLNKLCLTLINLEQEAALRNAPSGRTLSGDNGLEYTRANPAVRLNLRVLLAANFSDYAESLKFLSAALAFFQRKNVLTAQNCPTLDRQLDKLLIELETVSTHEWSQLWGMLGSKLLPAVVYRVRMLTLQETPTGQSLPAIGAVDQQAS